MVKLRKDEKTQETIKLYERGFPVGFMGPAVDVSIHADTTPYLLSM